MDVVAQIYADMMSGKVANFLANLSGGSRGNQAAPTAPFYILGRLFLGWQSVLQVIIAEVQGRVYTLHH